MASTWGSSFGVAWGVSWNIRSAPAFDGGGIPLTRGQLKRIRRQADEERRKRDARWDAGLLASKELIEQITRALEPATVPAMIAADLAWDDEDEEIAMLLMVG